MEQRHEDIARFISGREEGEAFSLKAFVYKLIGYWYWFVPAMIIGMGAAVIYNWYTPATYAVTGTLFVEEKSEESISLNNLFDHIQLKQDVKIPNHLGILASFSLNRQVIENLGWKVTWFRDGRIRNSSLITEEPFKVIPDPAGRNLPNIPLYVEKLSSDRFVVYTGSKPSVTGEQNEIRFKQEGEFGKRFKNQYFSFTLLNNNLPDKGKYYFMFVDQDALALDYMKRLEITRLDKNMDLISIRLESRNPQKDIEYVNELENVYVAYGLKQKNKASEKAVRFIDQQLKAVADTLGKDNDLYAYLLEKRSEAEVTKASSVSDIEIIDRARYSTVVEVGPRKMINLLMGLFFGFAIPFLMVILKEFFNETILRKEELEKLTPLPVIGNIKHNFYADKIPVLQYPRSLIAESFRELRTNLETFFQERDVVVVGVHSVVFQEGKSFVALNLACIFAINNRKVILIGADLRKPDLHEWFGLSNEHGLSTYLAGDDTLEQVISVTSVNNLHLIPSGPVLPNPAEFLNTKEFGFLITGLKSRYDVIIIDNAPFSVVTEGAIVRRHTDIDLFVIRQGYSGKEVVDFVNQVTGQFAKKTGVVFNDIHPGQGIFTTGYRYRHLADPYFSDRYPRS
jgi:capsular exopolysaccharide synthesis family protein